MVTPEINEMKINQKVIFSLISNLVCESLKLFFSELLDTPRHNEPVLVSRGDELDVFQVGRLWDVLFINQTKAISNLELRKVIQRNH